MGNPAITVYRNFRLLDPAAGLIDNGSVIVVEGNRIAAIGRASDVGSKIEDANQYDLNGWTVLPGLINAHEHITWRRAVGDFTQRVVNCPSTTLLGRGFGHALVSLLEGVTTVRDVGSKEGLALTVRNAIEAGEAVGPRILSVGAPISMTGGHGSGATRRADGVDEVRRAARDQLEAGADWIKLMASGGFVARGADQPTAQQYSAEEMRAAFDEAHRAGRKATVHCHPPHAIRTAIEAGVDCIEHAGLADEVAARLIAAEGLPVVPTLIALRMEVERGAEMGRPQWLIEVCRQRLTEQGRIFGYLLDAGCKILAGVDSLGDLQRELEIMVELGQTPANAIASATSLAAECLGVSDLVGSLEPGRLADFIAVEGNPLSDIGALRHVQVTVKDGVAFERATLLKVVGQALETDFRALPAAPVASVEGAKT